jgi:glycerol-3-phosphate cytidylyltransferase-like family protein
MRIIGLNVIHKFDKLYANFIIIAAEIKDSIIKIIEIYLSDSNIHCKYITKIPGFTWRFRNKSQNTKLTLELTPDFNAIDQDIYTSEVFSFNKFTNKFHVSLDFFEKSIRHLDQRPVWLFIGPMQLGPMIISSDCKNISSKLLNLLQDEQFNQDIIVIGNKSHVNPIDVTKNCAGINYYITVTFNLMHDPNILDESLNNNFVFLFVGASNLGKSFIAMNCLTLKSYETDQSNILPDKLECNIVVIGNRKKFEIEDIKSRFNEDKIFILVTFQKLSIK